MKAKTWGKKEGWGNKSQWIIGQYQDTLHITGFPGHRKKGLGQKTYLKKMAEISPNFGKQHQLTDSKIPETQTE